MTNAVSLAQQASTGVSQGFKNRIINGAMVIDQRNAGASIAPGTGTNLFPVDRFYFGASQNSKLTTQQNAGAITPPVGFSNYLGITSSSAYSVVSSDYFFLEQPIEGFNTSDLMFGTANAKTITLSFWVRSSGLTYPATFGGSLRNSATSRSYPFSYTINSANTWEYQTITIPGDTSGTWIGGTNGIGLRVAFSLGMGSTFSGTAGAWASANYGSATGATSVVGTNGATLYITGVQLEVGSTATSFDYRPYGTELQLCQRYFVQLQYSGSGIEMVIAGAMTGATNWTSYIPYPMRASPTVNLPTSSVIRQAGGTYNVSSWSTYSLGGAAQGFYLAATVATSLTANSAAHFYSFQQTANFSAEL